MMSLSHEEVEEGRRFALDYGKLARVVKAGNDDVVPVCVQDVHTGEVLILAFANAQAVAESLKRRVCVLWSTSRSKLWIKGEASGDVLDLLQIRVNCEQNSLLYLVRPRKTGACHTKDRAGNTRTSCFYRVLVDDDKEPRLVPASSRRVPPGLALALAFAAGCAAAATILKRARL